MSSDIDFTQGLDIPKDLDMDDLRLTLMGARLRYSLRMKPADLPTIKKASGLKFPSKIGAGDITQNRLILCLGPDEWLVIADPKITDKLSKALIDIEQNFTVSLTDISHRNIGLELSGARAVNALNVGCPIDLSLAAFPIGKTTRTIFEAAPIVLTRLEEHKFHIECWRSFAPYIRDFFMRIANDKRA